MGDVVMVREYWGVEPGKADLLQSRAAFSQFFGTKEQPNKPACTALLAVLPSAARGALVEIDVIAVRPTSLPARRRAAL
jgi:hypothetical protein